MGKKLIGPFTQMLTLDSLPLKGAIRDEQLEITRNGGIVVDNGIIVAIGVFSQLVATFPAAEVIDVGQPLTAIPGFVDCHTHICFAGSRAEDYAMRVAGKSYLEIAKSGGGIWSSVSQTRAASLEQLAALTAARADTLLNRGVTTIEVKSGYGLSVEEELKMLESIRLAGRSTAADLVTTCLAAHTRPRDFDGGDVEYLEHIANELLPGIRKRGLSDRVDIFIEQSAFSGAEGAVYLRKAKAMGFRLTVHADQFTTGGSKLAVEVGALSADHLEASTALEIAVLGKSDVVSVALPGASVGLGMAFCPARKLLDAGACIAIGSDWNPGSAPMGELLTQAAILGTYEKLSLSETLAGITYRASHALGLNDVGRLKVGQKADFQLYPTQDYRDIVYYQGMMKPIQVWKSGNRVH